MKSNLQEILIAIGLFLVIPTSVYLGCKLISPAIDYKSYWNEREAFFQGYSYKEEGEYAQRENEWKQTDTFIEYQKKQCDIRIVKLLVAGPLSVILFYVGSVFVLPIIGAGLLATGLSLISIIPFWIMWWSDNDTFCLLYGIQHNWIELAFSFLSLLIVLWYAYQRSERKYSNN